MRAFNDSQHLSDKNGMVFVQRR